MKDKVVIQNNYLEDMLSVAWIFPYDLNREEIFQNNIKHTYNDLKEWIKEKAYLQASNEILSILKFDSQIKHQKEISKKHEQNIVEIETKMNEGISPYKWTIFKDFDEYINKESIKVDYALYLERCRYKEVNLIDFHIIEIISEKKDKIWKLYGMSEKELEKEKAEAKNTLFEQGWIEHLLSDGLKQKYKYWDDGGEFVGENIFNLTRGDKPYFVGYVGQH